MKCIDKIHFYSNQALDFIEDIMLLICGIALTLPILAIFFDIIMRHLINKSLPWSIELSEFAMVYMTVLAVPWIQREKGHVSVDIFLERLNKKAKKTIKLITFLLSTLVVAVLAWISLKVVIDSYQRVLIVRNIWAIPRWIILLPIPFGLAVLTLELFRNLIKEYNS